MSEVLLPTWIVPEEETHEWLDEGSSVFSAAFAPGIAQRQSYGGLRLKLSRKHTVRGEEKAQLLSILKSTRGRYNVLRTKVHFALRGSGLGSELLSNTFSSNPLTASNSNVTLTLHDRVARATRTNAGAIADTALRAAAATTAQYAPYVARVMGLAGRGAMDYRLRLGTTAGNNDIAQTGADITTQGLQSLTSVVPVTTTHYSVLDGVASRIGGDYFDIPYISLTRCPQVDNGLNSLLQSDEFDATWTTTRASVDDQAAGTTAPDATSTADAIIGTAVSDTHFVSQAVTVSSAVGDYAFGCVLKAGAQTFALLQVSESVSSHTLNCYFDLSTGAVGTDSVSGANWTNSRAFIAPLGDGWYVCYVAGRKASAATTLTVRIYAAASDGTATYTGDGATADIYAWRATLVQSGVPTRLTATTTTAATGTSQTGNALHVKGLPASTNGLLLPGDWIAINGELKQCTAALNSDAAGLGYLQFEPPLVRSPSNDDPVIVTDPMGKFLVSNIKVDNEFGTQAVVTYDLEHIYE
jgi:hypothetical protein